MKKGVMILLAAMLVLGCTYVGTEKRPQGAISILESETDGAETGTAPDTTAEKLEETQNETEPAQAPEAQTKEAPEETDRALEPESKEETENVETKPQETDAQTPVTEETMAADSNTESDEQAPADKEAGAVQANTPEKKPANTESQAEAEAAAQAEAAAAAAQAAEAASTQNAGGVTEVSRTYIEDCGEDSGYWEIIYSDGSVEYIDD